MDYLQSINRQTFESIAGEHDLQARIQSYELAAKMQTAAKEAFDLSQETKATRELYGLDNPKTQEYSSRCLVARRLVERGVRFVQIHTATKLGTIMVTFRNRYSGLWRKPIKGRRRWLPI